MPVHEGEIQSDTKEQQKKPAQRGFEVSIVGIFCDEIEETAGDNCQRNPCNQKKKKA